MPSVMVGSASENGPGPLVGGAVAVVRVGRIAVAHSLRTLSCQTSRTSRAAGRSVRPDIGERGDRVGEEHRSEPASRVV
jgi:hypothetical protein